MHDIKRQSQVNVSFTRLWDGRIDHFTRNGLNPEMGFDARALERFSQADLSAVMVGQQSRVLVVAVRCLEPRLKSNRRRLHDRPMALRQAAANRRASGWRMQCVRSASASRNRPRFIWLTARQIRSCSSPGKCDSPSVRISTDAA